MTRKPPWFLPWLAWYAVGAAALLSLLAILSFGLFLAPVVLVAAVLLARSPRTRHSFPGAVAGLGLPLLWVAAANAGGPGEACTPTDGGMTCTDQWSPWPWLAAGLLLTAAGIALSATRARKNPDTPGHVHTPHP
ncbi:hypothetical protein [Streptacidiphilus monticola]|uniref:Integral membrane protein n=1 Tax=Streptacidiphilus monticola TaxID=2161674 RepID=A0ABW1G294_9ACTN